MSERIEISEEFKTKFKKIWESPIIQAAAFIKDSINSRNVRLLNKYGSQWRNRLAEEEVANDELSQEYLLLNIYFRFIDYLVKQRKCELDEPFNDFLPLGKRAQEWYDWIEKQEKEEKEIGK